jgi:hypothetical protein
MIGNRRDSPIISWATALFYRMRERALFVNMQALSDMVKALVNVIAAIGSLTSCSAR